MTLHVTECITQTGIIYRLYSYIAYSTVLGGAACFHLVRAHVRAVVWAEIQITKPILLSKAFFSRA